MGWDFYRGKAQVGDAIPFTATFLMTGYFLWGLPRIWQSTARTRLDGLVLPVFTVIVMAYLGLALRVGFIQPPATAIAVLIQAFSLVILLARSP
jgi:hypothetical protein